jgi:hypothetical protein
VIEAGSQPGASDLVNVDTRSLDTSISGTAPPGTYYVRVRGRNACGLGPRRVRCSSYCDSPQVTEGHAGVT